MSSRAIALEWEQITQDEPSYVAAWRSLAEAWLRIGRTLDVVQLCDRLADHAFPALRNLVPYLRGKLCATHGELDRALESLDTADQLDPSETTALRHTCRILFEAGRWTRARDSLERLADRVPDDPSVFHNLGIARWHTGDATAARRDWQRALHLRPGYPETERLLRETSLT